MDTEEAYPEAAAILREAGWKPHDQWGVYTRGTLVMGLSPDGQSFDVKNTATAPDGPDTPDDPVEAARWLVRLRSPAVVVDDVVSYEPPPASAAEAEAVAFTQSLFGEPAEAAYGGENDADTSDSAIDRGETSEAAVEGWAPVSTADDVVVVDYDDGRGADDAAGGDRESMLDSEDSAADDAGTEDGQVAAGGLSLHALESAAIDADFAPIEDEPPERDALDADLIPLRGIAWDENTVADELGAEILDEGQAPQDRFIGLDDLDRRRSLRIGDVIRYALEHAPRLTTEQVQRLQQLRSYVAGVAESTVTRSSDDAERRAELDALEAASSLEAGWNGARDAKVTFLNEASREDVEAFDVAADWP